MDIMERAREIIDNNAQIVRGVMNLDELKDVKVKVQTISEEINSQKLITEAKGQPKTLLDTVKNGNQKTKVVDGEQVLVEDLSETGNITAIPKTETSNLPTETKTERGETFKNNTIEIWNNDGKYGISINKQLHEIPQAIYDLFLRMVENHRQILTELESEIHNNKKLKVGMVNQ